MDKTLREIGEFELLRTVVLPALERVRGPVVLGDDCGIIPLKDNATGLVVTTDAAPIPFVWHLGYKSYEIFGWQAVTVNVSDLAAGGAEPLSFSSSVEAPADMPVKDLAAFFAGIANACEFYGLWTAGGNVRSAGQFACHGTAIGVCKQHRPFTRRGLESGDVVLCVGPLGHFMAAVMAIREKLASFESLQPDLQQSLVRPTARIHESLALSKSQLVKAAIDNSDGMIMSLYLLAEQSKVDIEVEMDPAKLSPVVQRIADKIGCDPWNIAFAWGDYQLVVGVASNSLQLAESLLRDLNTPYTVIGKACPGKGRVWACRGSSKKPFRRQGNENFVFGSYADGSVEECLKTTVYGELYE